MDAKELFKNDYGISVEHSWSAYNGHDMIKFAESYHQHRQAEEAQGRCEKARALALRRIRQGKLEIYSADKNILNELLELAAGIERKEDHNG